MSRPFFVASLALATVGQASAALTVTYVATYIAGVTQANGSSNNYDRGFADSGHDDFLSCQSTSGSTNGKAESYAQGYSGVDAANGNVSTSGEIYSLDDQASAYAYAISRLRVDFTLSETSVVSYNFWTNGSATDGNVSSSYAAFIADDGGLGTVLVDIAGGDVRSGAFTLAAGNYFVFVGADTTTSVFTPSGLGGREGNGYAYAGFNLAAAPVPEPVSLSAMALGCLALTRRRKKS